MHNFSNVAQFYSKSGKHIKVKYILLFSFLFLMNYKKEIPNVEWGNPHAAKDAYVMSYIDQDIQQWPTLHTHTHHYMLHGLRPLRIPW